MRKNKRFERLPECIRARSWRVDYPVLALSLAFMLVLVPVNAQQDERSGKEVVDTICAECHRDGVEGAPKIGDLHAWVQRLKQGLGFAIHSAIRGHGGMPARGGQANLTDTELRAAILYMDNPAGGPVKTKPVVHAVRPGMGADTDPNRKSVGGIDIHLGFMPAEMLQALPAGSPERSMHGGIPKGSGYYHVNVSLFDENDRAAIDDAQVRMQFEQAGRTSAATELDSMSISAGSYGAYMKPQPKSPALITLRIFRPGTTKPVEAKFEHIFE